MALDQFIGTKYNKKLNNLDKSVSMLLNDFDISVCQSAMYKNNEGLYKLVASVPYVYSILTNVIYYNYSQFSQPYNKARQRIKKYEEKWKTKTLFNNNHIGDVLETGYSSFEYYKKISLFYNELKNQIYNKRKNNQ